MTVRLPLDKAPTPVERNGTAWGGTPVLSLSGLAEMLPETAKRPKRQDVHILLAEGMSLIPLLVGSERANQGSRQRPDSRDRDENTHQDERALGSSLCVTLGTDNAAQFHVRAVSDGAAAVQAVAEEHYDLMCVPFPLRWIPPSLRAHPSQPHGRTNAWLGRLRSNSPDSSFAHSGYSRHQDHCSHRQRDPGRQGTLHRRRNE